MASGDPTMITVDHWRRILDGELYAASARVDWALLLRRTHGVNTLRCPKCTARMRVMATISEPGAVKKIRAHLALPAERLRGHGHGTDISAELRLHRGVGRAAAKEAADRGACTGRQGGVASSAAASEERAARIGRRRARGRRAAGARR